MNQSMLGPLINSYPSLKGELILLEQDYEKKLWHNVCIHLENIVYSQELQSSEKDLLVLYENFITKCDTKLNSVKLALIISSIIDIITDVKKANHIIDDQTQKIEKKTKDINKNESLILLKTARGAVFLKQGETLECKKVLDASEMMIKKEAHVDNTVNAYYYRIKSDYFKASEKLNDFYRSSLLYLSYSETDKLSLNKQRNFAFEIGLAALLGDRIYSFGELLGSKLIESLKGTQAEWLLELLTSFSKGDFEGYEKVMQQHSSQIDSSKALSQKKPFLKQKMQIMSILNLIFLRDAGNRIISFSELENATGATNEQIEHLLLKALSLGLIKGSIDEVSQTIQVDWVLPRVLDREEIESVSKRIGKWLNTIEKTENLLLESY